MVLKLSLFCFLKYKNDSVMGRNNERNIKKHNDKLHKEQDKAKAKKVSREEKLKEIIKKFNDTNSSGIKNS